MMTQGKRALIIVLLLAVTYATVTNAGSVADIEKFIQENAQKEHHYGLYYSDKEERLFTAITGLFSGDKEEDFLHMLVDTDKIALMKLNVNEEELKQYAAQQGVEDYPFI